MYTISAEIRVLRLRSDKMWRIGEVRAREGVRMIGFWVMWGRFSNGNGRFSNEKGVGMGMEMVGES